MRTLANHYFSQDKEKKGQETAKGASLALSKINPSFIPGELKSLYKNRLDDQHLMENLIYAGEKTIKAGDRSAFEYHLVTAANRILGAERGALFVREEGEGGRKIRIQAANNLTSEQIAHSGFKFAWNAIKQVIQTGEGCILSQNPPATHSLEEPIRSLICAPIRQGDK